MKYINKSTNTRYVGINSFSTISSKRKRRLINYQISFFAREIEHKYDSSFIEKVKMTIPSINYSYSINFTY